MPRQHRQIVGRICPGELWTTDQVMEIAGIGREQLSQARQSGIVKPYPCGGNHYYKSDDIMAWILSGGEKSKRDRRKQNCGATKAS